MDMRKLVGRNFARLRLAKGFTQERFAEVSGFTQQYVSGLERGRRNPTVVTLYHLAVALQPKSVRGVPCRPVRHPPAYLYASMSFSSLGTPSLLCG
jgi:transcriptional regulator with XRE-family HTH domain